MRPPPQTPVAVLARPRVSQRLERLVSAHPLTVVTAPAGAGKTTAIRQLVSCRSEPCAWLTVEPLLDDPAALAAALCGLVGGEGTRAMLAAGTADPRRLAGALADDLDTRPTIVVFDDAHLVRSPAARSMLRALAERIGPSARMLIVARGTAPLALGRLRSAGRVAEVGGDELRFSTAEARTLADLLGVETDAAALTAETDGSPALLRLALLAGGGGGVPVFDYLAEEVLDALEPRVCHALEDSAVLAVLSPETVAAVTGFDDAEPLLEQAIAAGLPLMTGAGLPRVHDLLRDLLLARLLRRRGERGVRELHRRAARALGDDLGAAGHRLAAGEPDEAERTLRVALEAPPDPPLLVVAEPVAELAGLFLEQQREREAAALALPWLRNLVRTRRLGLVLGFGRQGQTAGAGQTLRRAGPERCGGAKALFAFGKD